jgi:hypothetical protein
MLLTLWDGNTGHGPGGTADTVSGARREGKTVLWIDSNAPDQLLAVISVDGGIREWRPFAPDRIGPMRTARP